MLPYLYVNHVMRRTDQAARKVKNYFSYSLSRMNEIIKENPENLQEFFEKELKILSMALWNEKDQIDNA